MMKNRTTKYVVNGALLAVLAAAGITAFQLGTSSVDEMDKAKEIPLVEKSADADIEGDSLVDADTSRVEAEMAADDSVDLASADSTEPSAEDTVELAAADLTDSVLDDGADDLISENSLLEAGEIEAGVDVDGAMTGDETEIAANTSSGVIAAPELDFSEDTLMQWPLNGNILQDYSMEQTVYFPTLDQYKLSSAIAVEAAEGAEVLAAVKGTVISVSQDARTGTTVTMDLGNGYQAIYGQLMDLGVAAGDTVEAGQLIGYVSSPTKYYCVEGSNLYFAMKKDGEPIDPIAYLP